MRIVVTGASGFLGHAVAKLLISRSDQVIACAREPGLRPGLLASRIHLGSFDDGRFADLLVEEKPDCIVHCAGASSVGASLEHPTRDFESSVALTSCIYANVARYSPTARVVFLSSAAVYGQPEVLPINDSTPCNPISPYGQHKLQCERIGQWYQREHGLCVVNLRIFSAYGPGLAKQILWDIFVKSRRSSKVTLSGDGDETRDLVYGDDIAAIVEAVTRKDRMEPHTINVASGSAISIRNLAEKFLSILNYSGELEFSGVHGRGVPRFWSHDGCTLARLGLEPSVSLNEGLERYAKWLHSLEGSHDSNSILARAA